MGVNITQIENGEPLSGGDSGVLNRTAKELQTWINNFEKEFQSWANGFDTGDVNKPISIATQIALDGKAAVVHEHDSRYYTKTEVDAVVADKAPTLHEHDSRYYTKSQIDTAINDAVSSVTTPLPGLSLQSVEDITGVYATVLVSVTKFGYSAALKIAVEYRTGSGAWTRTTPQTPTDIGTLSFPLSALSILTNYEVRAVAYDTLNPHIAVYSAISAFSTLNAYIATPTVSVSGYPDNTTTTPTLSTSAFSAVGLADTHLATTWRAKQGGLVVWEAIGDTTNKESIQIPSGYIEPNTEYVFEAIHIGSTLGNSATGTLTAITANNLEVEYLLVGGGGTTALAGGIHHGGASGGECIAGTVPVPLFATSNVVIGGRDSISTALGITARSGIGASRETPANTPWLYGKGGQGSVSGVAASGQDGFQWVNGEWYGGGGGASSNLPHSLGGRGGGGIGGGIDGGNAGNGAANTGGGGGGGSGGGYTNGYGGSGIFIARYAGTAIRATGGTITTSGGYTYHTFTASGVFTVTG